MDKQILTRIKSEGLVPVIVIKHPEDAFWLGGALMNGGIKCAEITFRTEGAPEAVRIMRYEYPEMLIGAGTVLNRMQADNAAKAGAHFLVSPGLNLEVAEYAKEHEIPYIPGVMTPTEIEQALGLGFRSMKFFPANLAGGPKMLQAFASPYSMVEFMPTGGISLDNLSEYLSLSNVYACGGSWMAGRNLINEKKIDQITELTKQASKVTMDILKAKGVKG